MSDLHLEATPLALEPVNADVVVLAGDIAPVVHGTAPRWARKQFPKEPIVWVLGNHEHYGFPADMDACIAAARDLAREFDIHLLAQDSAVIHGVRFLGCTLWTDFRLQGTPELSMTRARLSMSDFSGSILIAEDVGQARFFRPQDSVEIHRRSVAWLHDELTRPFDGKTVVVTHHAPHPRCEHPSHLNGPLPPAFCSDLSRLIQRHHPSLWISGHTHASHDFMIGATRLLSNQRGYRDLAEHGDAPFLPRLVIDL